MQISRSFVRGLAVFQAAAVLSLSACHDAPRENPLDPVLTPPVELTVALDDTAGTATLTWTPYAGEQPFSEYRVLRKVQGLEAVETLTAIAEVGQRTYVDRSMAAGTPYVYRVAVVNASGFEVLSTEWVARPLQFPAVAITSADFDSRTATAALSWTPYRGPRFQAYQVWRRSGRTDDQTSRLVFTTPDSAVTSYVDSSLTGATEYTYQVVVLTDRSERVPSAEVSGAIHRLLSTWPLPVGDRGYVRLYAEAGGRIAALVSNWERRSGTAYWGPSTQLFFYDADGQLRDQQLVDHGFWVSPTFRGLATALDATGTRFLSWGLNDGLLAPSGTGLMSLAADGQPALQRRHLFAEAFAAPLELLERRVMGEITLLGVGAVDFRGVTVDAGSQHWEFLRDEWLLGTAQPGALPIALSRTDPAWQSFRLEADVFSRSGKAGIQVGGEDYSRLVLWWDPAAQQASLDWFYVPPGAEDGLPQEKHFTASLATVPGLAMRFSLEVVDGQVTVLVYQPLLWFDPQPPDAPWNTLTGLQDRLVLTAGTRVFSLTIAGIATALPALAAAASETRAWELASKRGQQFGICLPLLNQVYRGVSFTGGWPFSFSSWLGKDLAGAGHGELIYPLSFDVGLDGRAFVLDAGNQRVQAFDADGQYLTQWGQFGSGDGEFDFGGRAQEADGTTKVLDFSGSICVDDDGYIYVADVNNRRIQKFAP